MSSKGGGVTTITNYVIATDGLCNNTVRPLGRVLQGLLQPLTKKEKSPWSKKGAEETIKRKMEE